MAASQGVTSRKIGWGVRAAYIGLLLLNATLDGFAKKTSGFEYISGLVWPALSRHDTSMGVVVPVEKRVNRISLSLSCVYDTENATEFSHLSFTIYLLQETITLSLVMVIQLNRS